MILVKIVRLEKNFGLLTILRGKVDRPVTQGELLEDSRLLEVWRFHRVMLIVELGKYNLLLFDFFLYMHRHDTINLMTIKLGFPVR